MLRSYHPVDFHIVSLLLQAYAEHVQEFKDSAGLKEVSVGYVLAGALGGAPKSPLYGLLKHGALDEKEQKKLGKCPQVIRGGSKNLLRLHGVRAPPREGGGTCCSPEESDVLQPLVARKRGLTPSIEGLLLRRRLEGLQSSRGGQSRVEIRTVNADMAAAYISAPDHR